VFSTSTDALESDQNKSLAAAAASPYLAVIIGLYVLRNAWAAILLYHLAVIIFLIAGPNISLGQILRSGWNPAASAASAAMTVLGGVMLYLLWPYVRLPDATLGEVLTNFGLGGTSWVLFVVYYSTVHPLIEELYWRGDALAYGAGPSWRDIAFGGYHFVVLVLFIKVPWAIAVAVLLSAIAWGWRYAVRRYGGLGVPVVSHAVADLSIVMAVTFIAR
jgi:membrane protease YdiL (CAAX protease family)